MHRLTALLAGPVTMQKNFKLTEKEFSLICEVITSFHAIHDMEEMFLVIFQKIRSIFDIDGASLALHDPERKEFYFIRTVEGSGVHAEV